MMNLFMKKEKKQTCLAFCGKVIATWMQQPVAHVRQSLSNDCGKMLAHSSLQKCFISATLEAFLTSELPV